MNNLENCISKETLDELQNVINGIGINDTIKQWNYESINSELKFIYFAFHTNDENLFYIGGTKRTLEEKILQDKIYGNKFKADLFDKYLLSDFKKSEYTLAKYDVQKSG